VYFNWSSNSRDIISDNKFIIIESIEESSNRFRSQLIINNLNEMDFKAFKCIAYNELGSDEVMFEVVKKSELSLSLSLSFFLSFFLIID